MLNLLSASFRPLCAIPRLDLNLHDLPYVSRHVATQRMARGSLFRSVQHMADPDEMSESKIVDAQSPPFARAQNLFALEDSPQTVVA
jgi:hypothetical protein